MDNKFKQQLQEKEFAKLKDQKRVILKWATGCGKSKMAIDLINYQVQPMRSGKMLSRVLFLVAERAHINNWQDEFTKWHLNTRIIATDVCCYASLKKYKNFNYDIIVLDEAHHACAPKTYAYLEDLGMINKNSHVYLLSATLSSGKTDMIEEIFGQFTVSTVTLKDAIKNDILPDPKVYVVNMSLDDKIANQEIRINKATDTAPIIEWKDRNKVLFKNAPYRIKCTEKEKYLYYTNTMEYWKQRYEMSHNQFQHNLWVNTGSQRKRFLGELKTDIVRDLIKKLPKNNRFVCFCASVAQANQLDYVNTISSKRPMKSNQLIIDKFNEKKTNHIYAVGMITEGMNLTDIQTGIIAQLDGKERLFIQKFGRVCRADSPVCYIFYYKGTQDEVYLKQALANIDPKFIKHCNNINEL